MASKPVDRNLPLDYLEDQQMVMRWLYGQGMSVEDIRFMRWGMVDMVTRQVTIVRRIGPVKVKKLVRIRGLDVENFFMKSKIWAAYMFVKERPRGWSREKAYNSLYDVTEIEKIIGIKRLTLKQMRDNIRVANCADI